MRFRCGRAARYRVDDPFAELTQLVHSECIAALRPAWLLADRGQIRYARFSLRGSADASSIDARTAAENVGPPASCAFLIAVEWYKESGELVDE